MTDLNAWGGERGGFDDFEFTIEEAKFGYDEKYDAARGRNTLRFMATGTAVLDDGSVHQASTQAWNTGKGWDPVDGGARVAKEDGSELKAGKNPFHYQSGYSAFVRAAIGSGAGEELNKRCNGDPQNVTRADIWVGLKFRLQRIPQGTFKDEQGQDREFSYLLPTEFLGVVGGAAASPAKATGNGSGSLEELAGNYPDDKMAFLKQAVTVKGADISEAEKVWDKVNA